MSSPQQDSDGDGQVVRRTLFLEVGWRKIHREPFQGELAPAVAHRSPNPFLGFGYGRIRQADNVEGWQAGRNIHLYLYNKSVQPDYGAGLGIG